jgi:uncharacterized protein
MSVRRYDQGSFRKPVKTPEGYLKLDATLTRTGVFPYRLPDGTIRRELRLPEEVFNADSLASFALKPVTDEHPPVPVDATNAKTYARGTVTETPHQDGEFMRAALLVTDADLVAEIESREKEQLSNGYDCDLEETPGVHPKYGRYDAIQRTIRGNHAALVKKGRAGGDVRVHLDTGDGLQIDDVTKEPHVRKIRIDGVEYEVTEQVAQAIARLEKLHTDATEGFVKAQKEALKTTETAIARADAADAQVKKLETARVDAADPKRIDALVDGRLALRTAAVEVLGAEFKADGKDDAAIRAELLAKLAPDLKLEGKSPEYMAARFDSELEHFRAAPGEGITALGAHLRRDNADPKNPSKRPALSGKLTLDEARDAANRREEERWQQPLTKRGRKAAEAE